MTTPSRVWSGGVRLKDAVDLSPGPSRPTSRSSRPVVGPVFPPVVRAESEPGTGTEFTGEVWESAGSVSEDRRSGRSGPRRPRAPGEDSNSRLRVREGRRTLRPDRPRDPSPHPTRFRGWGRTDPGEEGAPT